MLWSIAFIGKMIIPVFGTQIFNNEDGDDFKEAILLIVNSLVFEIIPYILTLDINFIKIMQ